MIVSERILGAFYLLDVITDREGIDLCLTVYDRCKLVDLINITGV